MFDLNINSTCILKRTVISLAKYATNLEISVVDSV